MDHVNVRNNMYEEIKNEPISHVADVANILDIHNRVLIKEGGLFNKNEILSNHHVYQVALNPQYNNVTKKELPQIIKKIPEIPIQQFQYSPRNLAIQCLNKFLIDEKINVTDHVKLNIYVHIYQRIVMQYNDLILKNLFSNTKKTSIKGVKRNLNNIDELCSFYINLLCIFISFTNV